jgi:methylated-DNA-protein-cysteine methyltransferase related protein
VDSSDRPAPGIGAQGGSGGGGVAGGPASGRLPVVDDVVVERVLRAVEQVPRGRVVSYGDIGALVGVGPRLVGRIMSTYGTNVTWWRVTSSYGDLPVALMDEVRERWAAEGILLKPNGRGCRIAEYRADLAALSSDYERATADLTGETGA